MKLCTIKYFLLLIPIILFIGAQEADAGHAEPFIVSYTIIDYYSFNLIPKTLQETIVHRAVTAWTEHINAEAVFVPNALKGEVYCWITFEHVSIGIGHGGGVPGRWCQATVGSNQLLYASSVQTNPRDLGSLAQWRDAEVTLQHEIGHGFGLGHYGLATCQMFASYGSHPNRHCDQELDRLQMLWALIEPHPLVKTYDGAMKSFSGPSTAVRGDTVRLDWTIENVGTFLYSSPIWFFDFAEGRTIKFGPVHELAAGETVSGSQFYKIPDTASIGEHKIRGCYLAIIVSDPEFQHLNDINRSNNCINIFINITDIAQPPPPPPEPEPIPAIDYTMDFTESILTTDVLTVNLIKGPEPTPDPLTLEERVTRLESLHEGEL